MRHVLVLLGLLLAPAAACAQDGPDPAEWQPLVAQGRAALAEGRFTEAAEALGRAQEVWGGWDGDGRLVFACDHACSYTHAPLPFAFGNRYPLESFVWERHRGGLRTVASFANGASYDCENGHEPPVRSRERLTVARHGVDGWLLRERDAWTWMDENGAVARDDRSYVWACTRASGACARVEERVERCAEPDRGPRPCTQRYVGEASVRRGLLTIGIDEGELPAALESTVDLAALRGVPGASDAASGRVPMRGCRVEVHDERPPLNVRASPSARAAIVGTLEDGRRVTPDGPRRGAWVRLRAPVTGWVWVRNLRRVCAAPGSPTP